MAKRISIICDRCGDEMGYNDGEDDYISGIRVTGEVTFKVHQRRQSGSSTWGVDPILGGDFCSFECFDVAIAATIEDLRRYKKGVA